MNTQAIAQHLNIIDSAIIEIQEWTSVLWVKFVGGVRFVSKKIGAKKMEELTGTEKQIAWASDIRSTFAKTAEEFTAWAARCPGDTPRAVNKIEIARIVAAEILAQTDAKFWIDNRVTIGSVHFQQLHSPRLMDVIFDEEAIADIKTRAAVISGFVKNA
jgi:hypothetical protein